MYKKRKLGNEHIDTKICLEIPPTPKHPVMIFDHVYFASALCMAVKLCISQPHIFYDFSVNLNQNLENFRRPPLFRSRDFQGLPLKKCLKHHYIVYMHVYKAYLFLYLDTRIEIFEAPPFFRVFFSKTPLFGVDIFEAPPTTFAPGTLI